MFMVEGMALWITEGWWRGEGVCGGVVAQGKTHGWLGLEEQTQNESWVSSGL